MIRAMMGKKKIEYVLYCNQGTPDVFVDGTKVGTVKDGVCKWLAKRYDKDVTVRKSHTDIPRDKCLEAAVAGDVVSEVPD